LFVIRNINSTTVITNVQVVRNDKIVTDTDKTEDIEDAGNKGND